MAAGLCRAQHGPSANTSSALAAEHAICTLIGQIKYNLRDGNERKPEWLSGVHTVCKTNFVLLFAFLRFNGFSWEEILSTCPILPLFCGFVALTSHPFYTFCCTWCHF